MALGDYIFFNKGGTSYRYTLKTGEFEYCPAGDCVYYMMDGIHGFKEKVALEDSEEFLKAKRRRKLSKYLNGD